MMIYPATSKIAFPKFFFLKFQTFQYLFVSLHPQTDYSRKWKKHL